MDESNGSLTNMKKLIFLCIFIIAGGFSLLVEGRPSEVYKHCEQEWINQLRCENVSLQLIEKDISNAIAPSIKKLILRNNSFGNIKKVPKIWKHFPNLQTLEITENLLDAITGDLFKGLYHLKSLVLSKNKINDIHKSAFQGLSSLVKLDLQDSGLRTLAFETLVPLTHLETLHLSDNQFQCGDCNLEWIWKELTNRTHTWKTQLVGFHTVQRSTSKHSRKKLCVDEAEKAISFQELALWKRSSCVIVQKEQIKLFTGVKLVQKAFLGASNETAYDLVRKSLGRRISTQKFLLVMLLSLFVLTVIHSALYAVLYREKVIKKVKKYCGKGGHREKKKHRDYADINDDFIIYEKFLSYKQQQQNIQKDDYRNDYNQYDAANLPLPP